MNAHRSEDRARWIQVEGARTHNLSGVSVRVPKHSVTVFTGVSGSGKSSLAFGTIAAEAQRLVADTYPLFVRNRLPSVGHAEVDRIDGVMFTTVVDQRPFTGNARSTVATASDIAPLLRMLFSRIAVPNAGYSPAYSFNDPLGMCPRCEGLGMVQDIDLDELLDSSKSLNQGAIRFPTFGPGTYRWKRMVHAGLFDADLPLSRYSPEELDLLLNARHLSLQHPDPEYPKSRDFDGVLPRLRESYLRKTPSHLTTEESEALERVVTRSPCPECAGTRLNDAARSSLIGGRSIADWCAMNVHELRDVVAATNHPRVTPLLNAMRDRLAALEEIGLGYLSLDRISTTLSGGEAQRVKLVRHLGSALSDVCYILDEPSLGLHPHDVHRLLTLLVRLREAHNTVLVVEHHPAVIAAADHVIDLGPGAGTAGGHVVFEGPPSALSEANTATGHILHAPIRMNTQPRTPSGSVWVEHATEHNLRDVSVQIPLGVLTAVTGVAGSGKSSLAADVLPRQHPEFTVVGRQPLRGGSRSMPATVLGIADTIREAFCAASGLSTSWFSPNAKGGCPVCKGRGEVVTDLAFMDDVATTCEACGGSRFNDTALAAKLDGHTIAEVLGMNAADTAGLFPAASEMAARLRLLDDVGLGYLSIGQATNTLSGGERQRLLLAKHLGETGMDPGLKIVLDEPTAGLHGEDVDRLLTLFDRMVNAGASIVVIEHNRRVIAHADHVIDIGPGAGHDGGTVVYEGRPGGLLAAQNSLTGYYLRTTVETGRGGR